MGMLLKFLEPQSPYLSSGNNILFSEVLINFPKSAQHKTLSLNEEKEEIEGLNYFESDIPKRPLILGETSALPSHPRAYSSLVLGKPRDM